MMDDARLIKVDLENVQDEMVGLLGTLVTRETPSRDKSALDGMADLLSNRLKALGATVDRVVNPIGGDHLRSRFFTDAGEASSSGLIIGHYDTVWPLGTTAARPFLVQGDKAFGPGSFDMKASLVMVEFAIAAIRKLGVLPRRPIEVLFTSDEEIGSPTSRALIEDVARRCSHVLVVEPALADGGLKTARKGVGGYLLEVVGKSAHAGVEPGKGVNAILELAHQVLALHQLNDPGAGSTLSVGVISGGTTSNVVPAEARALVDVRATTMREAERLDASIRALSPRLKGATLAITGGFNRPPMERTEAGANLFHRATAIGRTLGIDLTEGSTGGGSDGNFTAAIGIPTLDGLGPLGGGAHATDEHVRISSMIERSALLAMLILTL
jgi:glutamate carboxypeptidase